MLAKLSFWSISTPLLYGVFTYFFFFSLIWWLFGFVAWTWSLYSIYFLITNFLCIDCWFGCPIDAELIDLLGLILKFICTFGSDLIVCFWIFSHDFLCCDFSNKALFLNKTLSVLPILDLEPYFFNLYTL